jgi:hypothetical protein
MPINLQRFCGNEWEVRQWLRNPFKMGACVYACNGHIALRVPRDEFPDVGENEHAAKSVVRLFEEALNDTHDTSFAPIPDLPPNETCGSCKGTGREWTEGETDSCFDCNGLGVAYAYRLVGDAGFNSEYLRWLHELPNARIATRGEKNPALILFDGGQALLMPMRAK